jgi:hypothetical protein
VDKARCQAAKDYIKEKNETRKQTNKDAGEQLIELKKQLEERKKNKFWKTVYPINNYDFDYAQVIKNKYNPYSLGITNTVVMPKAVDNMVKLNSYSDALLETPFPNEKLTPGFSDVSIDQQYGPEIIKIKNEYSQMPLPYPDFNKDYPPEKFPTTGANSSSYFIRTSGYCPSKITTKEECLKAGLEWVDSNQGIPKEFNDVLDKLSSSVSAIPENLKNIIPESKNPKVSEIINKATSSVSSQISKIREKANNAELVEAGVQDVKKFKGACFKPRFAFINNVPKGFLTFRGLGPSSVRDVMSLSPDKIMTILNGQSVDGTGIVPCPSYEKFIDFKPILSENIPKSNNQSIYFLILSILTIFIIFLLLKIRK